MEESDDKAAARILNDIGRRLIWTAATIAIVHAGKGTVKSAAEAADNVLEQYDRRFDPIQA